MSNLINGPWSADANHVYFDIRDADGDAIADTCATSCDLEAGKHKTDPRTLAVTSLIVASPDMLDALKAVRDDLLMRAEKDSDGVGVVDLSHGAWMKLNNAIEKAEGGQK